MPAAMMHRAHVLSLTVWVGDTLTRHCIAVEEDSRRDQTRQVVK